MMTLFQKTVFLVQSLFAKSAPMPALIPVSLVLIINHPLLMEQPVFVLTEPMLTHKELVRLVDIIVAPAQMVLFVLLVKETVLPHPLVFAQLVNLMTKSLLYAKIVMKLAQPAPMPLIAIPANSTESETPLPKDNVSVHPEPSPKTPPSNVESVKQHSP
jgi:hypothetical protein